MCKLLELQVQYRLVVRFASIMCELIFAADNNKVTVSNLSPN